MDWSRAFALTLHLLGYPLWIGGLVAIAALLVAADRHAALRGKLAELARTTGRIADGGAALSLLGGFWMLFANPGYYLHQPWMHIKLTLVALLLGFHGLLRVRAKKAAGGDTKPTPTAFVGLLGLLAVLIVGLVVFKPLAR